MFKRIFTQLCNERNESPAYVCEQLGFSNSVYSKWTDTSVPRPATLLKIANYFDVQVDFLTGKSTHRTLDEASGAYQFDTKDAYDFFEDKFASYGFHIESNSNDNSAGEEWYITNDEGTWFYLSDSDMRDNYLNIKTNAEEEAFKSWLDTRTPKAKPKELDNREWELIQTFRSIDEKGRNQITHVALTEKERYQKEKTDFKKKSAI